MRVLSVFLAAAVLVGACERPTPTALFVDPNGFVHSSAKQPVTVRVAAGMSADQFIALNPALNGMVWIPSKGQVFDEMRLALQARATLVYDDGALRFTVCADSASIDGNSTFKSGVAVIGFILCDPPLDEVAVSIAQAAKLLELLRSASPAVQDLGEFYRSASQAELLSYGGKRWANLATSGFAGVLPPRDNPESWGHLKTLAEARAFLLSRKIEGRAMRGGDGRVSGGNVLVGVFGNDKMIIEVGISGSGAFGGENLTFAQANAIRYQTGANIRLRSSP